MIMIIIIVTIDFIIFLILLLLSFISPLLFTDFQSDKHFMIIIAIVDLENEIENKQNLTNLKIKSKFVNVRVNHKTKKFKISSS